MTDAHCHVPCGRSEVRELLIGRDFAGVHPWDAAAVDSAVALAALEARLRAEPRLGVGEIGLDRLKERTISPVMRDLFEAQLRLAAEYARPVVLHGAKCWGQVVAAVLRAAPGAGILFHGFSRSDGLIPEIVRLGGFISVGPAVLNDHAVNYREMVRKIPLGNLLVETDRTELPGASVEPIFAKLAELRQMSVPELEAAVDANFDRFHPFAVQTGES